MADPPTRFILQTEHKERGYIVIDVDDDFSTNVQLGVNYADSDSLTSWVFLSDEDIDDLITVLQFYRKTGRVEL